MESYVQPFTSLISQLFDLSTSPCLLLTLAIQVPSHFWALPSGKTVSSGEQKSPEAFQIGKINTGNVHQRCWLDFKKQKGEGAITQRLVTSGSHYYSKS